MKLPEVNSQVTTLKQVRCNNGRAKFQEGREQTVCMRALCTQIIAARAYEEIFSCSKGHLDIGSFGPV